MSPTIALYRSALAYARVDGRYAGAVGDLRVIMGSATYAHAASAYRGTGNAASSQTSALDQLMQVTGGVKVSFHVPAVVSSKQNAVVRLGMRRDYVAPIWEGITLIPDEVTKAKAGQIVITAVMLHATKLLRADAGSTRRNRSTHRAAMKLDCKVTVLEAAAGKPPRLTGTLITFGEPISDGRRIVFERGSLSWPEAGVVVLNRQHAAAAPILRFTPVDAGDRLLLDAELPATAAGADAHAEVEAGLMTGASVEVVTNRQSYRGGMAHVTAGRLVGAALVHAPAFPSSKVEVHAAAHRRRRTMALRPWRQWFGAEAQGGDCGPTSTTADALVDAILASAGGSGTGRLVDGPRLAVVEACAGWWGRSHWPART